MATDDFINQQLRDILSRNPDATHPEMMRTLAYRARLNWGRVPASVSLVQHGLDSAADIIRKYSPDQPRVPAGQSDGGRWTRDPNSSEGGREAREAAKPKVRAANTSEGANVAAHLDARNKRLLEEVSRQSSKYDVLKNPDGSFVYGPTGELVKFPKEFPPNFFIEQGKKTSPTMNMLPDQFGSTSLLNLYHDLSNFRINGKWDIQRIYNETSYPIDNALRDYSTIAIGLYAYGAQFHPWAMAYLENWYAERNSKYRFDEVRSPFGTLPQRNVDNTYIGYELGRRIDDAR